MAPAIVQNISSRLHRMSASSADKANYNPQREEEKQKLAAWEENKQPLEPHEVAKDPSQKPVGHSSKLLRKEDFDLIKTLGTGTFARVWLTRIANRKQQDASKVFALKILRKTDVIRLKQVEHVRNERNVLAAVAGHPFITTMVASFQDNDTLYMLLDYCPGGEVFSYLRRARRFNEPTSQFYAAEIVLILEFLHEKEGVAYRDLKPENILIDAEGHLKLVDFGFAKKIEDRKSPPIPPLPLHQTKLTTSIHRRNLHPLRHARISRPRSHPQHGPRHRRRLVGLRHPDLRIPRRPTALLGPKPDENLRADRRGEGALPLGHGPGRARHHRQAVHGGREQAAGQRQGRRGDGEGASVVQEHRLGCRVPSPDAGPHRAAFARRGRYEEF